MLVFHSDLVDVGIGVGSRVILFVGAIWRNMAFLVAVMAYKVSMVGSVVCWFLLVGPSSVAIRLCIARRVVRWSCRWKSVGAGRGSVIGPAASSPVSFATFIGG